MKQTLTTTLPFLLLFACSSEPETAGIAVQAVTSDSSAAAGSLVMTDDGGSDYELQSASLHLRHIELDLPDGGDCADVEDSLGGGAECQDGVDEDKIRIEGPFEVDLVMGESTPSLADIEIPAGVYKRIDFRVEDNADDVSFRVEAGFEHGGETLTLELSLDFNEDIRIEEANGTTVDADTDLIAAFVVDNWMAGVDIGTCLDDEDLAVEAGRVVVDDSTTSGSCSDIENTIKDNMKNSGQFDKQ